MRNRLTTNRWGRLGANNANKKEATAMTVEQSRELISLVTAALDGAALGLLRGANALQHSVDMANAVTQQDLTAQEARDALRSLSAYTQVLQEAVVQTSIMSCTLQTERAKLLEIGKALGGGTSETAAANGC